jgi:hypothetical protein
MSKLIKMFAIMATMVVGAIGISTMAPVAEAGFSFN